MAIATIRPAATIVVLRRAPHAYEVMMLKRNDKVAFMAGAYVFPGGRVDDADSEPAPDASIVDGASRFPDLSRAQEWRFRIAAVRELEEEAAVRVTPQSLEPLAHWVTPEIETRRYDTRFFVTVMPEGQIARHDAGEMTDLIWVTPLDAIARCRRDEIMLPPPTWTTLRRLSAFGSIDEVLAWARSKTIVRVQPAFTQSGERTMLTLPGDPTYPTIAGWEIPEDTRFLLENGRWRPVPA
jgi:8-oxo-dGTP pyrophosphatase MutT (NUDIX family)